MAVSVVTVVAMMAVVGGMAMGMLLDLGMGVVGNRAGFGSERASSEQTGDQGGH